MRRTHLFALLTCAVALATLVAFAPPAEAGSCYGKCEIDLQTFCRTCVASPTYTGVSCNQVGPCGCIYVDDCPHFRTVEEPLPDFLKPAPNQTPLTPQATPDAVTEPEETETVAAA